MALKERGLFIILLWVSVTFLICHTPRAILNIYEFHCDYMKKSCLGKYSEIETRNVTYLNYEKSYELLRLFMRKLSSKKIKVYKIVAILNISEYLLLNRERKTFLLSKMDSLCTLHRKDMSDCQLVGQFCILFVVWERSA